MLGMISFVKRRSTVLLYKSQRSYILKNKFDPVFIKPAVYSFYIKKQELGNVPFLCNKNSAEHLLGFARNTILVFLDVIENGRFASV